MLGTARLMRSSPKCFHVELAELPSRPRQSSSPQSHSATHHWKHWVTLKHRSSSCRKRKDIRKECPSRFFIDRDHAIRSEQLSTQLTNVIFPKSPSASSLIPAVKNSSLWRPAFASLPKPKAHRSSIVMGVLAWSLSWPRN